MLELIQQGKIAELIISLIFDLILTVIAYLLVPAIFCIAGYNANRSYSLKTIRKIVFINGGCVWVILQIARFYLGETRASMSGVLLWSFVAYWIMKKFLLKKDVTPENNDEVEDDEAENDQKIEFEIVDKNKKRRSFKIPLIIVTILLVLSIALNLYQLGLNNQSNKELEQNRNKLDFFDEYIVLVENDNTNWYHKYECYRFKQRDFWAYNIDQAENLGYEPCPNCCK